MSGPVDIAADVVSLTRAMVDIASVSGDEARLADLVEAQLRAQPALAVHRDGNVIVARTDAGRPQRVVLAGHLDTVPIAGNLPSRVEGERLTGCGTSDMKSGLAVMLRAAHLVGSGALEPWVDLTWVCYDCEEVAAERNGLGRVARENPSWLAGDLAILFEGTDGTVEGGCQGTLRVVVGVDGQRAHSARSWLGRNAIHAAAPVLDRLATYVPRVVDVDGLTYREGLNAVRIEGGVAGNVVPDRCEVTINYRFAPDRGEAEAFDHVRELFGDFPVQLTDTAPGVRPGLDAPLAARFARSVGGEVTAKLGWTDVARFGVLGIPALNFGPGDANLAHTVDEWVSMTRIRDTERAFLRFLTDGAAD